MNRSLQLALLLVTYIIPPPQVLSGNGWIELLAPTRRMALVNATATCVTGLVINAKIDSVQVLEPFVAEKLMSLSSTGEKEKFPREIRNLFPDDVILGTIRIQAKRIRESARSIEYRFAQDDNIDIKRFWSSSEFKEILTVAYASPVVEGRVRITGWRIRNYGLSRKDNNPKGYFSGALSLSAGANIFYLRGVSAKGEVLGKDSLTIYVRTDIVSVPSGPSDLGRETFHTIDVEKQCRSCHSLDIPQAVIREKSPVESQCKSCHSGLVDQRFGHPPASGWDCLSCHDPSSKPKFDLYNDRKSEESMCFDCHADKAEDLKTKAHVHAVAQTCLVCHDPHGSRREHLLVADVNTVCRSCHQEIADQPHPVVGHPLEGRSLPGHPESEISCASCHNPHASANERLLTSPRTTLCQQCHTK